MCISLVPLLDLLKSTYFTNFFLLEFQKPDEEEMDFLNREEEFCLPQNFFVKEEP